MKWLKVVNYEERKVPEGFKNIWNVFNQPIDTPSPVMSPAKAANDKYLHVRFLSFTRSNI